VSYFDYLSLVVCFVVTTFGLGLPLARRWFPDEVEGLCAAAVFGLLTRGSSFCVNLDSLHIQHGTNAFNACLKEITLTRFLSDTLPGAGLVGPLAIMFVASLVWWRSIHPSKSSQPPV
jgi:hypothetical protein